MFKKLKLRTQIFTILLIPVFMYIANACWGVHNFTIREEEHIKSSLELAIEVPKNIIDKHLLAVDQGSISKNEAISNISHDIRIARHSGANYYFVLDGQGKWVIHPKKHLEGHYASVEELRTLSRNVIASGAAYTTYVWESENKISYGIPNNKLNWVIGTGMLLTDNEAQVSEMYISLGIEIAVALLVLILLAEFLSRSIRAPINEITNVMNDAQRGVLTSSVSDFGTSELGELGKVINHTVQGFSTMVSNIKEAVEHVESNSVRLFDTITDTSTSLETQQNELEQVSAAINEMVASIRDVARSISNAADSAKDADTYSLSSMESIAETVRLMEELSDRMSVAVTAVVDLAKDTDQISTIVTSIDAVADQTNLLALNAAIEAARAGDAGRGFAVVAEEVRALSSRTGENTTVIRDVITNLQSKAQSTVDLMNESHELFTKVFEATGTSSTSVDIVNKSINEIEGITAQVASATEQQSVVSEEINQNLTVVAGTSTETVSATKDVQIAAEDLSKLALELKELSDKFVIK